MRRLLISACAWLMYLGSAAAGGEVAPPKFTAGPKAAKENGKVRIDFAVDRETDVTVAILDAAGRTVRHLVSGRLGAKAPAPLVPGLTQSIEWDGKADNGQPALAPGTRHPAPFKVRVSLGLTPQLEAYMFADPGAITGGTECLGVDREGRLYHTSTSGNIAYWNAVGGIMRVYDRGGKYLRTLMPFPPGLTAERLKGTDAFEDGGRLYPVWHCITQMRLYPGREVYGHEMPVDSKGNVYKLVAYPRGRNSSNYRLRVIAPDGGAPADRPLLGAELLGSEYWSTRRQWIALSSDEKWIYLSGVKLADKKAVMHAVYRAPADGSGAAKPFIGDPKAAGKDGKLLNAPKGVCADGKGLVYVSDSGNNRIAVFKEADGSPAGAIPVEGPFTVQVHPRTGAVYVLSATGKVLELVKISGRENPKEVGRLVVGRTAERIRAAMVLDASAEPPVIWCGGDYYSMRGKFLRIEDRGAGFSEPREMNSSAFNPNMCADLQVDRARDQLYVKYSGTGLARADIASGEVTLLPHLGGESCEATQLAVPPAEEAVYSFGWGRGLRKWTRDFKPLKFAYNGPGSAREGDTGDAKYKPPITAPMTYSSRGLAVDPDGNVHVIPRNNIRGDGKPTEVQVYAPDGRRKGTSIWRCDVGATGPRFDAQGNIYMVHCVKAPGKPLPDWFAGKLPEFGRDSGDPRRCWGSTPTASTAWMYSSIVKYSPKGGLVWWCPGVHDGKSGWGQEIPEEILALPRTKVCTLAKGANLPELELVGAEWYYYGVSPFCDKLPYGCNCQSSRFDVDEYGRSFFPDVGRFRIGVLDTAGNEICFAGSYGNRDCTGKRNGSAAAPGDEVGEPEIAFAYPYTVAVSRTHVFVGDHLNNRVAKLKMAYAAEETVPLQ